MFLKFIAHAGFYIECGKNSLLVDPWFTDSSLAEPIIRSPGGHVTIDFQIPPTRERPESFSPDAVLISHLHSHHAQLSDLYALVNRGKPVQIAFPDGGAGNAKIIQSFEQFENIQLTPCKDQQSLRVGAFTLTALSHTVPNHLAWHITTSSGSFLHIADARLNTDQRKREIDPVWQKFNNLRPHLAVLSAAGNSLQIQGEGVKDIGEAMTLTPIEGAKIIQLINPKAASLIGCYNHSIWKNRIEYIRPAPLVEDEFYWALSWLAPQVKCIFMKPGYAFGFGDPLSQGQVDTFIP